MMTPIDNRARLKLRYSQLDYLGWWLGGMTIDSIDQPRHDPIHQTYARVISTADWDLGSLTFIRSIDRPL